VPSSLREVKEDGEMKGFIICFSAIALISGLGGTAMAALDVPTAVPEPMSLLLLGLGLLGIGVAKRKK
jgi:hypothetical protein